MAVLGAIKRSADLSVKKGRIIQTAQEFYDWGSNNDTSLESYILVEITEIQDAAAELKCLQASPIPGTMKIHSVVAVDGILYVRDTSCFKPCCYKAGKFLLTCGGWKMHNMGERKKESSLIACDEKDGGTPEVDLNSNNALFAVGDHVAVRYTTSVYLGKVLEYDRKDGEYFLSFI